jgi:hypothetical protein
VRLRQPETAQALTGCAMGAVPPFSLNPDLAIVVDEDLLANDTLFFNAGRLDRSMELDTQDWIAVARPGRPDRGEPERAPSRRHERLEARADVDRLALGLVLVVRTVVAEPYTRAVGLDGADPAGRRRADRQPSSPTAGASTPRRSA